jgi:histidine triad (HIT) family protein
MPRCIFCDIASGRAPASRLYADDQVLAFLDINPVNAGHALVIPRLHCQTLLDVPDELMGPLGVLARRVAAALMKTTGAGGFNLQMNNYAVAGQLVPHAHLHVIPRHPGDGLRLWPGRSAPQAELEALAERVRSALG